MPTNIIPSLDVTDNEGTLYACRRLNYSISSPHNSDISTISDITTAIATTNDEGHASSKEFELEGRRYNRTARGYFHRILPNGRICLEKSLW